MLTTISPNPFFAGVALGVEQQALENDLGVLLYNTQGEASRERAGVEMFIERRVDLILMTVPIDAANVARALDAGIPVVQVERPTAIQTPSVVVDNVTGATRAVQHLLGLGHRRIACLSGDPDAPHATGNGTVERDRLRAYHETMRAHGIDPGHDWVVLCDYYAPQTSQHVNGAYEATGHMLDSPERPTAIFAASDLLVAGALQAIYERKLRVPEDISVVGFDDTYSSYLSPPITTVRQPMQQMGRTAVRLGLDYLENDVIRTETLDLELVIRSSTGPAPQ
jgi:DNA-binding LacI/PurR family transcriptional regulator